MDLYKNSRKNFKINFESKFLRDTFFRFSPIKKKYFSVLLFRKSNKHVISSNSLRSYSRCSCSLSTPASCTFNRHI